MRLYQFLKKAKVQIKRTFFWNGSKNYWENRYRDGGNSGPGSCDQLAVFKANVVNDYVKEKGITRVIEWGCGDGNQLSLANYPEYVGIDVSQKAIELCEKRFWGDETKRFIYYDGEIIKEKGELSLSLDVIYHLVEEDIFETYMSNLFSSSDKYVCIYSCDFDDDVNIHVKCRKFSKWIEQHQPNWQLERIIKNIYPYDGSDITASSWSDFYFYSRV